MSGSGSGPTCTIGVEVTLPRSCAGAQPARVGGLLDRGLGADDLAHRLRVRLQADDLAAAAGRERLAEVDERLRLVDVTAAERDERAEDGPDDEAPDRQPPACHDPPPRRAEVDLSLRVGVDGVPAAGLAHRAATLPAAHSHCACSPSAERRRRRPAEIARRLRPVGPRAAHVSCRRARDARARAPAPRGARRARSPRPSSPLRRRRRCRAHRARRAPSPRSSPLPRRPTNVKLREAEPSPNSGNALPVASASSSRVKAMSGRCLGP